MRTPTKIAFFAVASSVVAWVSELRMTTSYFNLSLPQVNSVMYANVGTSEISDARYHNTTLRIAELHELLKATNAQVQALQKTLDENLSTMRRSSNEDVAKSRKAQVKDGAPTLENDADKSGIVSKDKGSSLPHAKTSTLEILQENYMTKLNISDHRRGNETFSACLIWNDDLARLPEWIAYHYQVLPLGHLVFFRDPESTLDPLPVLNRFKDLMNITYWTNLSDIMDGFPGAEEEVAEWSARSERKKIYIKQYMVYRQCFHHLKRMGQATWVFVGDTDEFTVLNNAAVPDAYNKMKQHGIILETIKTAHENGHFCYVPRIRENGGVIGIEIAMFCHDINIRPTKPRES